VDLQVDDQVRYVRPATHAASLPRTDLPEHEPALLDRVGDQVRERLGLLAGAGAVAGTATGVLAARAGTSGAVRLGWRAGLGALAGIATTVLGGLAFDVIRGRLHAPGKADAPVATGDVTAPGEHLRVMTFNIHGATGPSGEWFGGDADLERIAEAIEREHPDVVLLQEVNHFSVQNGYSDVLGKLADRLGADGAVFAPAQGAVTGRDFGNAVLTFNGTKVVDARALLSPDSTGDGVLRRVAGAVDAVAAVTTGDDDPTTNTVFHTTQYRPRNAADVLVETPEGNQVRVLSSHLSWPEGGVDHPRRQVDPMTDELARWDGPTIFGADFNVKSETHDGALEAEAFARADMTDAFTASGLAMDDPARSSLGITPNKGSRIDRIYASDEIRVDGARVVQYDPDETPPSDHRPVVADLTIGVSRTPSP
jgi:endonuclease/exonuclease/phosphatase family metal-dependent hydrolase